MVGMPPDKKLTNFVGAPIPGMSLTTEPGSRPWEQPPQYNTPKEALDSILPNIMSAEVGRNMIEAMERGVSAEDMTDGILLTGFSEGKWSVDVAVQMALPVFLGVINSVENLGGEARVDSDDSKDPELDALKEAEYELMELTKQESEGANVLEDAMEDEETPEDSGEVSLGSGMMPQKAPEAMMGGMENGMD